MNEYKADFHLHSVLSPCGDLLMTAKAVIEKAKKIGIDIISLTDHNSAENAEIFQYYCEINNIMFVPGMEVETKEEIHVLTFFPDINTLKKWQEKVYKSLPDIKNDEEFFGPQIVLDFNDKYSKKNDKMLAAAVNMTLSEVIKESKNLNGIAVPAHLDRNKSIISQLGFIPDDLAIDVVEISKNADPVNFRKKYNISEQINIMKNSDSHYLDDIRSYITLVMKEKSFAEFLLALKSKNGRKIKFNDI
nr:MULTISPECIES: PHP domain-containing protein [unclassified Halanaerobium]